MKCKFVFGVGDAYALILNALRFELNIQMQTAASNERSRMICAKLFVFTATAKETSAAKAKHSKIKAIEVL